MGDSGCLVIGASGFLGHGAVPQLSKSFRAIPTSIRERGGDYRTLDARDPVALSAIIEEVKPSCVAMLAAYRNPDECEENPEETRSLNTAPLGVLAEVLPPEAQLLFVSTDYVFDGMNPPYQVDSERTPVNVYGQSKKEAEDVVLARPNSSVLRVPLLMGWTEKADQSGFFSQLINDLKHEGELALDDVLARYPVWTRDVGDAMRRIFENHYTGALHFSTTRRLTRYMAACEMGKLLGWSTDHIVPSSEIIPRRAQRPVNAFLSIDRWKSLGEREPTSFKEVAKVYLDHFGIR